MMTKCIAASKNYHDFTYISLLGQELFEGALIVFLVSGASYD